MCVSGEGAGRGIYGLKQVWRIDLETLPKVFEGWLKGGQRLLERCQKRDAKSRSEVVQGMGCPRDMWEGDSGDISGRWVMEMGKEEHKEKSVHFWMFLQNFL